jgi:hypothetical protein
MLRLVRTGNPRVAFAASLICSIISVIGALVYFHHLNGFPGKPNAGSIQSSIHFRGPRQPAAGVVIVSLGRSGNAGERNKPVRRALLAEVIRCASREGAKAVTILGCLDGPSPYGHQDDLALISACRISGNVVIEAHPPIPGIPLNTRQWTCVPFAPIKEAVAGIGDPIIVSGGGTGWTVPAYGLWGYPELLGICVETVRVGMRLSRDDVKASKTQLRLGTRRVDLTDGELIVNFRGPRGSIQTLEATALRGGSVERHILKEAYVIVRGDRGECDKSLGVPLGSERGSMDGMMGVDEIMGNAIETLAGDISIRWLKLPAALAITFGVCLLFSLITLFSRWVLMVLPVFYGLLFLENRIDAFFFTKCIAMDTAYRAWAIFVCICLSLIARLVLRRMGNGDPRLGERD